MSAARRPEAAASRRSVHARAGREERCAQERALDRGLEQTFPASDPVAIIQPSIVAGRGEHRSRI
jgi:hypothetical protein